ncbi:17082_t:CDS:2, partial [Funneliformis caledonium]
SFKIGTCSSYANAMEKSSKELQQEKELKSIYYSQNNRDNCKCLN